MKGEVMAEMRGKTWMWTGRSVWTLAVAMMIGVMTLGAAGADGQEASADPAAQSAEAEGRWITGGGTDAGFEIVPIPLPSFEGLETTVREQLEKLSASLEEAILQGEMSRNGLGKLYAETGQVFHAYEFLDAAAACYQNAALLLPGDPRWPHLQGYVYQQKGDVDEARQHYGTALESGPNVATQLRLVEVDLQDGHLEQAERRLNEVLKDQPSMLAAHALMAEVKLAQADFEAAIAGFEAVLAQAPQANRYHYSLALAYRDNRNMEKAKYHMAQRGEVGLSLGDHLVEGLEERKRGERVYLLRGRRAFAAGQFEAAAEAFAAAVEAEPTSARSRVNLGSALASSGKPGEAIEQFRIVLQLDPDNATAHYNLGHLLAAGETPEAALPHFQFAVDADSKDVDARLLMATLQRRLKEPQKALALYEEILAIDPNHGEARFRQAAVLVDLGQYAAGRAKLEEALVIATPRWTPGRCFGPPPGGQSRRGRAGWRERSRAGAGPLAGRFDTGSCGAGRPGLWRAGTLRRGVRLAAGGPRHGRVQSVSGAGAGVHAAAVGILQAGTPLPSALLRGARPGRFWGPV